MIYNQAKTWNIEIISGNALLKSTEEEAGFPAIQSVVLCSFDFIRVSNVTIFKSAINYQMTFALKTKQF